MKHLLAIIFACLACVGTAQDNLSFAPYQCDNGAETLWLSKKPGNITIRVQVEVSGQRYIRCLLNGEFHHNHPVSGSGMVVVEYNGIGLGNPSPDHYITLSLWDDNVQTSGAVSIEGCYQSIVPDLATDDNVAVGGACHAQTRRKTSADL